MPGEPWGPILIGLALAAAAAAAAAWILRGAGIAGGRPAAAVVGGLLAGVLLGPAVLGRIAPGMHERLFLGAVAERRALDSLVARQAADLVALQAAAPTEAGLDELRARHAAERAPLRAALAAATAQHRSRLSGAAAVLLAVGIGAGAWAGRRPSGGFAMAPVAAAVALLAELGAMALLARAAFGLPWGLTIGLAAAGACGSAFAALPMRWVPRAGRTPLAITAGICAFVLACAAMALVAGPQRWPIALAPAVALLIGLAAGRLAGRGATGRRAAGAALANVVVPAVVAAAALHIEWWRFAADPRAWPLAAAVTLLAGNAAIAGLWLALRRIPAPPTFMDLVGWHALGFSTTQACAAALLIAAGLCDPATPLGSAALAGVLLSAAVGETTLGWMRGALGVADHDPAGNGARPPSDD